VKQAEELLLYFDGNEPDEPNGGSRHGALLKALHRGAFDSHDLQYGSEDAVLSYLDAKREWDKVEAKVEKCSDATLGVLAAWFAAAEKDRHRVVDDDVLAAACAEYAAT
jgi:hypothetical protein